MKLSTKGRYGLRIMMDLGEFWSQGPVLVEAVARRQDISPKYARVLLLELKKAGFVRAVRGPGGGYNLARHPRDITILDILNIMEGDLLPLECLSPEALCGRSPNCAARELWQDLHLVIRNFLKNKTLESILARQKSLNEGQLYYHI